MPQKLLFLSRFFSKLLTKLLPAVIASAVSGMLFISYYTRPPVTPPVAAIDTPGSAEMMQMVRDEHALIVDYLHKYTEAREQADLTAEQEMLRSRAAEQGAMLAAREARPAEASALAIAAYVVANPEKKTAAIRPAQRLDKTVAGNPLQLIHLPNDTTQIQPVALPTEPPARPVTYTARSDENIFKAKYHEVAAIVQRIPFFARSAAEWLSSDLASRLLTQLPERNHLMASM